MFWIWCETYLSRCFPLYFFFFDWLFFGNFLHRGLLWSSFKYWDRRFPYWLASDFSFIQLICGRSLSSLGRIVVLSNNFSWFLTRTLKALYSCRWSASNFRLLWRSINTLIFSHLVCSFYISWSYRLWLCNFRLPFLATLCFAQWWLLLLCNIF